MTPDTKTQASTQTTKAPDASSGAAPSSHAKAASANPPQLRLERVFNATPERLWRFWTDPKLYAKWIYPGSTDVAMHTFEPRVGGKVSFSMLIEGGQDMLNEGVFHVLDKPRRIESGTPDKSFLLVVTFEPLDAART